MGRSKSHKKTSPVPDWVGRYPNPPDRKQPVAVGRDEAILFTFGLGQHRVSCTTHISTDLIQCGIMIIPPGGTFVPPDIHAGNEVYYVNSGEIAVFDPASGATVRARQGEFVLIPKGVWHQSFNVSAEKLEVFAFIAPLQWKEGEAVVPTQFGGQPACLSGQRRTIPPMGDWPAKNPVQQPTIRRLGYSDAIGVVCGKEARIPTFFYVSDAYINVGEFTLPVGRVGEMESHGGDEVLFVLAGTLGVHIPDDTNPDDPLKYVFEIGPGQAFLIPQNCKHEYVNLDSVPTQVVFAVAPRM